MCQPAATPTLLQMTRTLQTLTAPHHAVMPQTSIATATPTQGGRSPTAARPAAQPMGALPCRVAPPTRKQQTTHTPRRRRPLRPRRTVPLRAAPPDTDGRGATDAPATEPLRPVSAHAPPSPPCHGQVGTTKAPNRQVGSHRADPATPPKARTTRTPRRRPPQGRPPETGPVQGFPRTTPPTPTRA